MIEVRFTGATFADIQFDIERLPQLKPAAVLWAKSFLKEEGFSVQLHMEWESIKAFCERLNIHRNTFTKCYHSKRRPDVEVQFGPSGKNIVAVSSNDLFDAFCVAGKNPKTFASASTWVKNEKIPE